MKCVKCGGDTRVIDSRDDSTGREDWLIRAGERVFGWWTSDFRLRNRKCANCNERKTTIEILLSDLNDSLSDLRSQLTITQAEMTENKIDYLTQDDLETLAISMIHKPNNKKNELLLTKKTANALVSEILYRRQRQRDAQGA